MNKKIMEAWDIYCLFGRCHYKSNVLVKKISYLFDTPAHYLFFAPFILYDFECVHLTIHFLRVSIVHLHSGYVVSATIRYWNYN